MNKNLFLIHGCWCSKHSFNYIQKTVLDDQSVGNIHCFEYSVHTEKIETIIERAKAQLEEISENGLSTVIVGHSLGGLIGIRLSQLSMVDRTITLSAPLSGLKFNVLLHSYISWHMPVLRELLPGSPFITALHNEDYNQRPIEVLVSTVGHNPMIYEPNDGVISIDAQMRWRPAGASTVICPVNHNEILQSTEAILAIERALESHAIAT